MSANKLSKGVFWYKRGELLPLLIRILLVSQCQKCYEIERSFISHLFFVFRI